MEDFSSIQALIERAEKDPLTSTSTEATRPDPETYSSIKHQLDIRLRKAVSGLAKTMKTKMKAVSTKRKEWLQSVELVGEELNETDLNTTLNEIVNSFIVECETNLYSVYLQTSFYILRSTFSIFSLVSLILLFCSIYR